MKRIKNGRMYDTDDATLVGSYVETNEKESTSFAEKLYVKRNGEFFLCVHGGANTIYANVLSITQRFDGSGIIPIGPMEAFRWVEMYLCGEEYANALAIMETVPSNMDITGLVPEYMNDTRRKNKQLIGVHEFGLPGEKTYYREELWRTRENIWRLSIARGANAYAGAPIDGYTVRAMQGRNISETQAKRWVEDHCTVEVYIRLFGMPKE